MDSSEEKIGFQVNQRLKQFADKNDITAYRMAADTGIHMASLYNYFSGKSEISATSIVMILKTYTDLNPTWLLLGVSSMFGQGKDTKDPNAYRYEAIAAEEKVEELKARIAELKKDLDRERKQNDALTTLLLKNS